MNKLNSSTVFIENEAEANLYAANCMLVLAGVVITIWVLNLTGIFIVPQQIMTVAAAGGAVLFLMPSLLVRKLSPSDGKLKLYIMICTILGIALLSAAMPKHGILAWAIPIVLSCHYYSRAYTWWTLAASIICMAASIIIGLYFGEWDSNLLKVIEVPGMERVVSNEILKDTVIFFVLPRSMILVGIAVFCTTLADRTHRLLEKQEKDQMEKQQIAAELSVATQIQTSMLPCIFPAFPERKEFDIYATMTPAKEVGGDFYDFFMVDDSHLAIVMADVSGKGVPAALFMVIGKTLIKDHTRPDADLGEVFREVNELLCQSNSEGLFITAFEGVLDLQTGQFNFVNAGHNLPYISRHGESFEAYKIAPGFVLAGMEEMNYRAGSLTLEPGDKLFQYTDGVTEAENLEQLQFGAERLRSSLNRCKDRSPQEILLAVKEDIDAFSGEAPQFDDITMLCVEFLGKMPL